MKTIKTNNIQEILHQMHNGTLALVKSRTNKHNYKLYLYPKTCSFCLRTCSRVKIGCRININKQTFKKLVKQKYIKAAKKYSNPIIVSHYIITSKGRKLHDNLLVQSILEEAPEVLEEAPEVLEEAPEAWSFCPIEWSTHTSDQNQDQIRRDQRFIQEYLNEQEWSRNFNLTMEWNPSNAE